MKKGTLPALMPSNSDAPEPVFHDPVLYQWFFFRRSDEKALSEREPSTGSRKIDPYLKHFWEVVKDAGNNWARVSPNIPADPPIDKLKPRRSCELISHGWELPTGATPDQSKQRYELHARSLLDVFWLHLGQGEADNYTTATLPTLTEEKRRFTLEDKLKSELQDQGYFIEEANCLSAEVEATSLSIDEWDTFASQLIGKWLPHEPAHTTSKCVLEFGYFAYVDGPKKPTLILLFYKRYEDAIARLRGQLLPNLALIYLKLSTIEREYDENISWRAITATKAIDEQLKSLLAKERSLSALEAHTTALSEKHLQLLPIIEVIESRLQTLRVNERNLEVFIHDSGWGAQPPVELPRHKELTLFIKQMESDLHYISITQRKVEVATEQLQTLASVRVAQSERRISLALSLFTVMAVAQVFTKSPWGPEPEDTADVLWKIGLIGGGCLLILFLLLFLNLKETFASGSQSKGKRNGKYP